jgi:hypothetical protein
VAVESQQNHADHTFPNIVVVQELLKSCEKLELLDCSFCEQLKLNIRQLRHSAFFCSA